MVSIEKNCKCILEPVNPNVKLQGLVWKPWHNGTLNLRLKLYENRCGLGLGRIILNIAFAFFSFLFSYLFAIALILLFIILLLILSLAFYNC